jgi:hypothetical protein
MKTVPSFQFINRFHIINHSIIIILIVSSPFDLKTTDSKKMLSPKEIAEANEDIEKDEDEVQEDKQEKKEK